MEKMNKETKTKLVNLLQTISYGFDYYQENEFEDTNASDEFWAAWNEMYEFIDSIPTDLSI